MTLPPPKKGGEDCEKKKVGMVEKLGGGDRHGAKVANMNIHIYAYGGTHGFAHVRVGCT